MWESKSKYDLIMEVWEKLDCESVGRVEIEAIETVVIEQFGLSKSDSPMRLARMLADEGAELRHAEIMELDVLRRTSVKNLPHFTKPIDLSSHAAALASIDELDLLRTQFLSNGDKDGIAQLREKAIAARDECRELASNVNKSGSARQTALEIAEWLTIWIQSPDLFKTWIAAQRPKNTSEPENE